jgi:hypothetical protein
MQHASTPVIAKAAPLGQNLRLPGRRQRLNRREIAQKGLITLFHDGYPRLLQHDLGNPDFVRIMGTAPGKITAIPVVPEEKIPAQPGHTSMRKQRGSQRFRWPPSASVYRIEILAHGAILVGCRFISLQE